MELLGNIIMENSSNQKCNVVMGYYVGGSDFSSCENTRYSEPQLSS